MKALFAAIFLMVSIGASAQKVTDDPVTMPAVKKKVEVTKVQAKEKVEAKKPAAKKPAPKKALPPTLAPEVRVYKNSADAPTLRDKSGNVIPTNPSAYDVSSATGKK